MSGSRPNVNIRVSADGAEQARKQIEAIGPAGEAAMRRINTASAAAAPELQKLALASDTVQRSFVGMGGNLGRVGSVFTGVAGVASGLTAGFLALGAAASVGAVAIAKAGDEATATLARLSSATGGLGQAQAVYESLFKLSQQTGVAVSESAGSFSRFSVAAKEIGATNDQVLKLVGGSRKPASSPAPRRRKPARPCNRSARRWPRASSKATSCARCWRTCRNSRKPSRANWVSASASFARWGPRAS